MNKQVTEGICSPSVAIERQIRYILFVTEPHGSHMEMALQYITRIVHKLRRSFSSTVTDEAADLLVEQQEEIRRLRQKVADLSRKGGVSE